MGVELDKAKINYDSYCNAFLVTVLIIVTVLYVASTSPQLSNGATLAIVAVICSTVFFILGTVFRSLCVYCVPKCKQLYNRKYGHQLSVSQQPVPDYEDVHHTTHSLEPDKHTIKLEENVAYGRRPI